MNTEKIGRAVTRARIESAVTVTGILLGMLMITALSWASFASLDRFHFYSRWVDHTQQVRLGLEHTALLVSDAQAAVRGYAVSGTATSLAPYNNTVQALPLQLAELSQLIADNPAQQALFKRLSAAADRVMRELAPAATLQRLGAETAGSTGARFVAASAAIDSDAAARSELDLLVDAMQRAEVKLLQERDYEAVASTRQTRLTIVGGTLCAFVLFGTTFWMLRREVRQRRRGDAALSKANTELSSRAGQLELANKELESFSYSISHDLRIPLRAVSGYASMLAEDYESVLDDEGKRLLAVIRDNGKRMGLLIDDLLAFSKLGRQALSAATVDMQSLAEHVLTDLAERDNSVPYQLHIETLPAAWGDRALLQQVWINLLSNAIKYSSKSSHPEIWITGICHENDCVYSIRDNGVGFDMTYYDKLFGVFQRLHDADEFPGTGVGLAIVQRIILRHGGRVWAEGVPGNGATFYFALPHGDDSTA